MRIARYHIGGGMIVAMPRGRTHHSMPDLFSAVTAGAASAPANQVAPPKAAGDKATEASLHRYVLPKDLPNAIRRLDDNELASLLTVVLDEAKRRDRLPASLAASGSQRDDPTPRVPPKINRSSQAREGRPAALSLTLGQVNAVRAAFKAGITPSRIAREFGISHTDVRKVLTSDARERGRRG
jgi:hypothetical protein